MKNSLQIDLLNASAACQYFPYPLKNLTGRISIEGAKAQLEEVVSQYNGRRIVLNGNVTAIDTERPAFNILINASDIPIDSMLLSALPDRERNFYQHFDVDGLANVQIRVFSTNDSARLVDYTADVKLSAKSMIYDKMPIPLADAFATARLTPDSASLEELTGSYGDGRVSLKAGSLPANGYSLLLRAEEIELNETLTDALPAKVGGILAKLRAKGRINITVELTKTAPGAPAEYSVTIDCLDNSITPKNAPYPLSGINGRIEITNETIGLSDYDFIFMDKQLENMEATIEYIEDENLWRSSNFVADCYDRKVTGGVKLQPLREGWNYNLQISFERIDLQKFMKAGSDEENNANKYTKGLLSGWGSVAGAPDDETNRIGRIRVAINDVEVGKLSLTAKLLTALRLKASGDFAFDQMRIDSYVQGNELFLESVDLLGQAVCMRGSGRMDLVSRKIDLHFIASGEGLNTKPSLLESLAIVFGPALIEMDVKGDFDNPQIETTTFPVIKRSLGILGTKR